MIFGFNKNDIFIEISNDTSLGQLPKKFIISDKGASHSTFIFEVMDFIEKTKFNCFSDNCFFDLEFTNNHYLTDTDSLKGYFRIKHNRKFYALKKKALNLKDNRTTNPTELCIVRLGRKLINLNVYDFDVLPPRNIVVLNKILYILEKNLI